MYLYVHLVPFISHDEFVSHPVSCLSGRRSTEVFCPLQIRPRTAAQSTPVPPLRVPSSSEGSKVSSILTTFFHLRSRTSPLTRIQAPVHFAGGRRRDPLYDAIGPHHTSSGPGRYPSASALPGPPGSLLVFTSRGDTVLTLFLFPYFKTYATLSEEAGGSGNDPSLVWTNGSQTG